MSSETSNWLEGGEPPEDASLDADESDTTSQEWFDTEPFIPTPMGEAPEPEFEVELEWTRDETTERFDMTVTSGPEAQSESDPVGSASTETPATTDGESEAATDDSVTPARADTETVGAEGEQVDEGSEDRPVTALAPGESGVTGDGMEPVEAGTVGAPESTSAAVSNDETEAGTTEEPARAGESLDETVTSARDWLEKTEGSGATGDGTDGPSTSSESSSGHVESESRGILSRVRSALAAVARVLSGS